MHVGARADMLGPSPSPAPPMRTSLLAAALLSATLAACQGQAPTSTDAKPAASSESTTQADAKFDAIGKRWLDGYVRLNPVYATQIGDHRFDATIDDYSTAGRAA